jgi:hypothetical protein
VGHWVAEASVPAEGTWSYELRHDLEVEMSGFNPIVVSSSAAQHASATAATTGTSTQPALLLALSLLSLLALAGVTMGIIATPNTSLDRARAQ